MFNAEIAVACPRFPALGDGDNDKHKLREFLLGLLNSHHHSRPLVQWPDSLERNRLCKRRNPAVSLARAGIVPLWPREAVGSARACVCTRVFILTRLH